MKRENIGRCRSVVGHTKWCPRCKSYLPFASFSKTCSTATGLNSTCRKCKMADNRMRRVLLRDKPDLTAEARFWPKVNKDGPGGCWIWIGAHDPRGYGRFSFKGNLAAYAHRVSLILHGITIPEGKVVDHMCKVLPCVNPAHLRLCTQVENTTIYADRSKAEARRAATRAANTQS